MFVAVLLVLLLLLISVLWTNRPRRPLKYPPGPRLNVLLGDVRSAVEMLKGNFNELLRQTRNEFGGIIGFILPNGGKLVAISDFSLIHEACSHSDMQGRSTFTLIDARNYHERLGVIFNEGRNWSEHRRFALRNLRDLGFGKTSMESIVLEEFEELVKEMDAVESKPMTVNSHFNLTVLNILWKIVAGIRLKSNDPMSQKHVDDLNKLLRLSGPSNPVMNAPWLRYVLPEWTGFGWIIRYRNRMASMMENILQTHRQNLDSSHPRDFIDLFLMEMEKPDAAERQFTGKNLSIIGMDLFLAGMETTSTSLSWALLFMVLHLEVQKRVQNEIDTVLGEAYPSYVDRDRLPYTEAVVMEIMRRGTVVPNSVVHRATADVPVGNYIIPRDTHVLLRLEEVHMDTAYWGDPKVFRPERFLKEDGTVRKDAHLIPFGVGKRFCLGETLAKMEMFMLFACLMQRYSFEAAPGQSLAMNSDILPIKQPVQFEVTYTRR